MLNIANNATHWRGVKQGDRMFRNTQLGLAFSLMIAAVLSATGCATTSMWGKGGCSSCDSGSCSTGGCSDGSCGSGCGDKSCGIKNRFPKFGKSSQCESCGTDCGSGCNEGGKKFKLGKSSQCESCGTDCGSGCDEGGKKFKLGKCSKCCGGCCSHRSLAIPDEYPVGAVERAHFHQMQTNGEAADFILHRKDFVLSSAELSPDGKDKILEIAARMRSAPFPVLIERSENNSDPELDAHRRALVAQILTDCGNPDANNRTFVSPAYGLGKHGLDGSPEFYQHLYQGYNNGFGGGASGGGAGGGGGGGGGGFGGGGGGGGGGFGGAAFGI